MKAALVGLWLAVMPPVIPVAPTQTPARQSDFTLQADFTLQGPVVQGGVVTGVVPAFTVTLSLDGAPVPMAADGYFLIAFDRDAGQQSVLIATRSDGSTVTRTLAVVPGTWRIERIDAPLRPTRSTAAFLALRVPELERIAAARAIRSDSAGWRQQFVWPVTGRISGLLGAQRVYRGKPGAYHGGVDVAAVSGTPVRAPADGVVVLAAQTPFTLEGNLLMIDHGGGLNSAFLHLSRIDVAEGTQVRQGQVIGAVGATGRATGPHLHWGMKWKDARIDPLLLTGRMRDEVH